MKNKLLIVSMILALSFVGCGATEVSQTSDKDSSASAETTIESDKSEDISEDTSDIIAEPKGKYSVTKTEELEGEEISYEISYTFNSDGTGVYDGQDTIDFTWNAVNITINGENKEYEANGDSIRIKEDYGWEEYTK